MGKRILQLWSLIWSRFTYKRTWNKYKKLLSGWQKHKHMWFFSGIDTPFNTSKFKKFTSHTNCLRLSKLPIWIQVLVFLTGPSLAWLDSCYHLTSYFNMTRSTKIPTASSAHRHPRHEAKAKATKATLTQHRDSQHFQIPWLSSRDLRRGSLCCFGNEVINLHCQYL